MSVISSVKKTSKKRTTSLYGVLLVIGISICQVVTSQFVKTVDEGIPFDKYNSISATLWINVFLLWFKTNWNIVLILPILLTSQSKFFIFTISEYFGFFMAWTFANFFYILGIYFVPVSFVSAVSGLTPTLIYLASIVLIGRRRILSKTYIHYINTSPVKTTTTTTTGNTSPINTSTINTSTNKTTTTRRNTSSITTNDTNSNDALHKTSPISQNVYDLLIVLSIATSTTGLVLFSMPQLTTDMNNLSLPTEGIFYAIFGVLFSVAYQVCLKWRRPNASFLEICNLLVVIGFLNLVLLGGVIVLWYILSNEQYVISILIQNVNFGLLNISSLTFLLFNLFLNFGVVLTYPVFISVGVAMSIVLNVVYDLCLRSNVSYPTVSLFGVGIIVVGFVSLVVTDFIAVLV